MIIYYACGHEGSDGTWTRGAREDSSICPGCRTARIGTRIRFARHGAVPPALDPDPGVAGQSRNHRDQVSECGVSVYEIVDGTIEYVGWFFDIAARPLYVGTGRIVGWGADGEPCVYIETIHRASVQEQAAVSPYTRDPAPTVVMRLKARPGKPGNGIEPERRAHTVRTERTP